MSGAGQARRWRSRGTSFDSLLLQDEEGESQALIKPMVLPEIPFRSADSHRRGVSPFLKLALCECAGPVVLLVT